MPRRKKGNGEQTSSIRSLVNSINKEKPQQRNAANARERARMRVLSRAFCRLKTTLPWVPADTKLSKLDTLRLASSYIAHLKGILEDDPFKPEEPIHPAMTLTWPFGFNRLGGSVNGRVSEGSDAEDEAGVVLDDGENSCGSSGSSWEEVVNEGIHVTPRTTDRIHLDSSSSNINKSYHHYQLPQTNYNENIISF